MKLIHKILLVILALAVAFTLWFHWTSRLSCRATVTAARAEDIAEAFQAAAAIVHSGAAYRTFSPDDLETAEGYSLIDASIQLKNRGMYDAEWLEITVDPADADVAVYSVSGAAGDVPAFSEGRVNLKLITRDPTARRSVTIGYYVLGMHKSVTVPLK